MARTVSQASSRDIASACTARVMLVLLLLLPAMAGAQSWPVRPVRIVVPATAGGGLDVMARFVAPKLSEGWGQPVVVENRPGANFVVGTDAVAKAAPDGYTLLLVSTGALSVAPALYPDLPYNVARDLAPITLAASNAFVLVVNSALPVTSTAELIAHLRANPGRLNHASTSSATLQLASELLRMLARVEYADINYKGTPQAMLGASTGESHFAMIDYGSAVGAIRGGRLRPLAMTSAQRTRLQPDLPALAETVPGYAALAWIVMLAPGRIPPALLARLNADMLRLLAMPDIVARFEAVGAEVIGSSPEEAVQVLRTDSEKWTRLVKERNIRVQ